MTKNPKSMPSEGFQTKFASVLISRRGYRVVKINLLADKYHFFYTSFLGGTGS